MNPAGLSSGPACERAHAQVATANSSNIAACAAWRFKDTRTFYPQPSAARDSRAAARIMAARQSTFPSNPIAVLLNKGDTNGRPQQDGKPGQQHERRPGTRRQSGRSEKAVSGLRAATGTG